jgi:hypothetical protein
MYRLYRNPNSLNLPEPERPVQASNGAVLTSYFYLYQNHYTRYFRSVTKLLSSLINSISSSSLCIHFDMGVTTARPKEGVETESQLMYSNLFKDGFAASE